MSEVSGHRQGKVGTEIVPPGQWYDCRSDRCKHEVLRYRPRPARLWCHLLIPAPTLISSRSIDRRTIFSLRWLSGDGTVRVSRRIAFVPDPISSIPAAPRQLPLRIPDSFR
jgi:hypothetical protein